MDLELIGVGISDRGFLPLWTSPSQFFFFFFSNSFLFFPFASLRLCTFAFPSSCVPFFPRLLFPFASLHLVHFSFKV
jgi:hypothetical protein